MSHKIICTMCNGTGYTMALIYATGYDVLVKCPSCLGNGFHKDLGMSRGQETNTSELVVPAPWIKNESG